MKRRTFGALFGLFVVLCLGLVLSVVFPITTSEPHATNPPSERFTVGNTDTYSASGSIVVDGAVRLAFEGIVTPDGTWYQRVEEENIISEEYHSPVNNTIYQRFTVTGQDRVQRFQEQLTNDDDRTLVRAEQDGDRVTFVVETNTTAVSEPVSGTATVFLNSLSVAGYENTGTTSAGVTVYEPRSGWYDGRETYRLTGASGYVQANAETHVVKSANVSWTVTTPAGSYAEYTLTRVTSNDPTTRHITFEFNPDDADIDRPSWITESQSASHDEQPTSIYLPQ